MTRCFASPWLTSRLLTRRSGRELPLEPREVAPGDGVARIQAQRLLEVRERAPRIALSGVDRAHVVVGIRTLRVETQHRLEVGRPFQTTGLAADSPGSGVGGGSRGRAARPARSARPPGARRRPSRRPVPGCRARRGAPIELERALVRGHGHSGRPARRGRSRDCRRIRVEGVQLQRRSRCTAPRSSSPRRRSSEPRL